MTNTICGHSRDALIWALAEVERRNESERATFRLMATFTPMFLEMPIAGPCVAAIADPAKLAEMMVARGRELGVERWEFTDWAGKVQCCFRRKLGARVRGSDTRELEPVQARAILLQWLQLPDGARDEAEKVLRGSDGV